MNLPPPVASKLCAERYETLRRHFIENRRLLEADPCGLTLLFQSGLAGWMHTWHSCIQASPKPADRAPSPGNALPGPVCQQELTRLIAQMTTQHLHPALSL